MSRSKVDADATRDSNAPIPPQPLSKAEIEAYLAYLCEPLIARRDKLIAVLQADAQSHAQIRDDDTLAEVAENVRMAAALTRTAEDRRKDSKEPFLSGGRVVDAWFAALVEPLSAPMRTIQSIMTAYAVKEEARKRSVLEAERKRAQVEADRAAAAAARALERNHPAQADAALTRAADTAELAQAAQMRAQAPAAELTRVRGIYGASTSLRVTWGWEITNESLVPRHLLMINPAAIKAAASQRDAQGKPIAVIPGINWIPSHKVGVR